MLMATASAHPQEQIAFGARDISNNVDAQSDSIPDSLNIGSFVWQWGQFVDHDMTLTRTALPAENFSIPLPKGDPQFDPRGSGNKVLPFQRSEFRTVNGIREQVNGNSAFHRRVDDLRF